MTSARPWSVPITIDEVPETGRHIALDADAQTRAEIARLAGLRELPRLHAAFDLTRRGADGLRVAGEISATVGQDCVVTLEPLLNAVDEHVELDFLPPGRVAEAKSHDLVFADNDDDAEVLVDGCVDLGALATEFLLLGIDPYPRKPGVQFKAPPTPRDASAHPFAALAALKKGKERP